jgi:hypothetical protein
MTNAGFVVIPNEVRQGLAGHPAWWMFVYQMVAGWSIHDTKSGRNGDFETWVPAIVRELEKLGVRTRQGTVPCDKSVRRVLWKFREWGWHGGDGAVNRARRCIVGLVRLTLSTLLGGQKRECPGSVSKWPNRRATGQRQGPPGPVSKSSVQGFQAGSSFFKDTPVDNSARAAWLQQGGPITPEALRAMYGR